MGVYTRFDDNTCLSPHSPKEGEDYSQSFMAFTCDWFQVSTLRSTDRILWTPILQGNP